MNTEEPNECRPALSEVQIEALVERLHDRSIEHKNETLRQLEARLYPTVSTKRLPKEVIEKSVERQVDIEMARRRTARENLELLTKRKPTEKLTPSDVERSVERLYTDSLARKKANMEESRRRHLFPGAETVKKDTKAIHEYVARLAVPKKREFTIEEVNKVYGLLEQ
uniref:Uncharacterized protein n=1 Tax=Trypanosoma congolense (strain IL3000) TaxID=1068625 RepID=G0UKS7_TRYCI|nr:conserved hypothetical protein [Trypanosoma congolense IL3000]